MSQRTYRYTLFALLYFVQGAITSYFTALNAIYLLSFDVTMSQIGIMGGIVLIPFVLKIFLGMLSDKVNLLGWGHRKPYIAIGLAVQAVCAIIAPFIDPGVAFWAFALLGFIMMTGMALYDTCTDGYALDTTSAEEQGTVQGFMVGGRAMGVVVTSGLIGLVVQASSWKWGFWLLAVITIIPLGLVFGMKEATRLAERRFEWSAFRGFLRPQILMLGLAGAIYSLVINGASQILNPFLQEEYQISVGTAGMVTMIWGIGVVAGGVTGGRLTDRLGHKRSLWVALVLGSVSILALAGIFNATIAWLLAIIFGLGYGYYETVYFALSMKNTDPRVAASMYSILMAIANVGTGIGLAVSGALTDGIGFRWTFVVLAVLNILVVPCAAVIFSKKGMVESGAE